MSVKKMVGEMSGSQLRRYARDVTEALLEAVAHTTVAEVELRATLDLGNFHDLNERQTALADRLQGLTEVYLRGFRNAPKETARKLIMAKTSVVAVELRTVAMRTAAKKVTDG